MKFYLIIENISDVIYIGDFQNYEKAQECVNKYEDNLTHEYKYILVSKTSLQRIVNTARSMNYAN